MLNNSQYLCGKVSNWTGDCNFSGQRNRSFFIVQDKGKTGQAQILATGQDGLGQPVKIRDVI